MKEIQELIKRVEVEINKTPTGVLRNLLCDINILLQQQIQNLNIYDVSNSVDSADATVCPKCGSEDIIITIYCNKCSEAM